MARRRFLVEQVRGGQAEIRGSNARHLARVLRTEPGRRYEISDGACVYLAEVASVTDERVILRAVEKLDVPPAPVRVTLCAALIKFDRFEWLVEKATEAGVCAIIPVIAARSDKGLAAAAARRMERWRRIAHESSQQARRVGPPEIRTAQEFAQALAIPCNRRYLLDEAAGARPLLSALASSEPRRASDEVVLLAGPEGGWTDEERAAALAAGWVPVSLGPLILRAETAALVAAGLLMHVWWASQLEY
jgi:16S rRNA (uracil1498-N3)-methyltransferase